MQRKSENKRNACEGSITLFLALTLTIILSLIFPYWKPQGYRRL